LTSNCPTVSQFAKRYLQKDADSTPKIIVEVAEEPSPKNPAAHQQQVQQQSKLSSQRSLTHNINLSAMKNSQILNKDSYYHEMEDHRDVMKSAPHFSENYEEYIRILDRERQREMASLTKSHRKVLEESRPERTLGGGSIPKV
jgi:hypothetical protein